MNITANSLTSNWPDAAHWVTYMYGQLRTFSYSVNVPICLACIYTDSIVNSLAKYQIESPMCYMIFSYW